MQRGRNLHDNSWHHYVKETPRDAHQTDIEQYDHRGEADGNEDNQRTLRDRNNQEV